MTEPEATTLQQIVQRYRAEHDLTQTELADALAEATGNTLSKASVSYWENGVTRPNIVFLLRVARRCNDWRRDFALDCLAAMEPGTFEPAGQIGREVLAGVSPERLELEEPQPEEVVALLVWNLGEQK